MNSKNEHGERGFVLVILAAGLLAVILMVAGLAIDAGRGYKVRGELQDAADASALAGAARLFPSASPTAPDWAAAQTAARNFVTLNAADGRQLTNSDVQTGYWDFSLPASQALKSTASLPGATDSPAVSVAISKSPSTNGSVPTFFARGVGWNEFQPAASAVAVPFPNSVPPGTAFPFAVVKSVKDNFLNGSVTTITLGQGSPDPSTGQWTSLEPGSNKGASVLRSYIVNLTKGSDGQRSPAVQLTGTPIDLEPVSSTMETLYQATADLVSAGKGRIILPVVQSLATPVVCGFVCMQLTAADVTNSTVTGRLMSCPKLVR